MKKLSILSVLLCLLLCFSGCGLTVTEQENTGTQAAAVTEPSTTTVSQSEESVSMPSATSAVSTSVAAQTSTTSAASSAASAAVRQTQTTASEKTTGKTTAASTQKKTQAAPSTTAKANTITCTVEISCMTILDNQSKLKETKREFLPASGMILPQTKVTVPAGSSAFDALRKACAENVCTDNCKYCKKNHIQLDFVYTPGYESDYVRGIHQIYEKDCGNQSGWMYSVNGDFPNYGCNQYVVKNGDRVTFAYTCDLGDDLHAN